MTRLPPLPVVSWTDDSVPRADEFNDIYFSRAGGLAESEAVFLRGAGLPEAWRGRPTFTIGELGFGTGLNALATWRAWRAARTSGQVLHFLSIENRPLSRSDAARALAAFPETGDRAAQLLARWPDRAFGPQRFWFEADGFCLTLFIADALDALRGWPAPVDAWFLDGFAPAQNPAMWGEAVIGEIARLSAPGARLATYSVAGQVRRTLAAHGFEVSKHPGFAGKRERLEARFNGAAQPHDSPTPYAQSGDRSPVAIIGAGLAGASIAHALARRGVAADVYESARQIGDGASGNPAALVMPRLDRDMGPVGSVHRAAFIHAAAFYEQEGLFETRGVEHIFAPEDAAHFDDLAADAPLPEAHMQAIARLRFFYPRAGVVNPHRVLKAMLARARMHLSRQISALQRVEGGWSLIGENGELLADYGRVVVANGAALGQFAQTRWLPLEWSRGQIEWGGSRAPRHALSGDGYVISCNGGALFGASHERVTQKDDLTASPFVQSENRARLRALDSTLAHALEGEILNSRVHIRTATPDRMAIAGLAPDARAWLSHYGDALKKGRTAPSGPAPSHDGLFIFGALGSRGFTLAPLLAERLASEICGEPAPITRLMLDVIHPARYLIRAAKRGISVTT